MYCDLHTHTTASDGDLTPLQLVELALQQGVAALGVTDHDTLSGLPEAMQAAKRCGIPLAWGVEMSACLSPGTLHILGYFIDLKNSALLDACEQQRNSREHRNAAILDKLTELGMTISREELLRESDGETVGRPHIAAALVRKGFAADKEDAFDRYVGKGAEAYVSRVRLQPEECIGLIRDAGGVAVLAHPFQTRFKGGELQAFIDELQKKGLQGIETHYWNHTAEQTQWLERLADEKGLLKSGGSDYHGPSRNAVSLGSGTGDLAVPFEFYDQLRKAAGRWL